MNAFGWYSITAKLLLRLRVTLNRFCPSKMIVGGNASPAIVNVRHTVHERLVWPTQGIHTSRSPVSASILRGCSSKYTFVSSVLMTSPTVYELATHRIAFQKDRTRSERDDDDDENGPGRRRCLGT